MSTSQVNAAPQPSTSCWSCLRPLFDISSRVHTAVRLILWTLGSLALGATYGVVFGLGLAAVGVVVEGLLAWRRSKATEGGGTQLPVAQPVPPVGSSKVDEPKRAEPSSASSVAVPAQKPVNVAATLTDNPKTDVKTDRSHASTAAAATASAAPAQPKASVLPPIEKPTPEQTYIYAILDGDVEAVKKTAKTTGNNQDVRMTALKIACSQDENHLWDTILACNVEWDLFPLGSVYDRRSEETPFKTQLRTALPACWKQFSTRSGEMRKVVAQNYFMDHPNVQNQRPGNNSFVTTSYECLRNQPTLEAALAFAKDLFENKPHCVVRWLRGWFDDRSSYRIGGIVPLVHYLAEFCKGDKANPKLVQFLLEEGHKTQHTLGPKGREALKATFLESLESARRDGQQQIVDILIEHFFKKYNLIEAYEENSYQLEQHTNSPGIHTLLRTFLPKADGKTDPQGTATTAVASTATAASAATPTTASAAAAAPSKEKEESATSKKFTAFLKTLNEKNAKVKYTGAAVIEMLDVNEGTLKWGGETLQPVPLKSGLKALALYLQTTINRSNQTGLRKIELSLWPEYNNFCSSTLVGKDEQLLHTMINILRTESLLDLTTRLGSTLVTIKIEN